MRRLSVDVLEWCLEREMSAPWVCRGIPTNERPSHTGNRVYPTVIHRGPGKCGSPTPGTQEKILLKFSPLVILYGSTVLLY